MNVQQIVLDYIKENVGTSYAELERLFDELGFDWKGELQTGSGECENVVFWDGWNKEAFSIINNLRRDGLIESELSKPLVYMIDGKILNLPIVKSARQYKKPHWLPIVFVAKQGG